jgi:hypothetical protein
VVTTTAKKRELLRKQNNKLLCFQASAVEFVCTDKSDKKNIFPKGAKGARSPRSIKYKSRSQKLRLSSEQFGV